MSAVCRYCKRAVDPDAPDIHQRVRGWIRKREQGGANAIVGREVAEIYACRKCIGDLKAGRTPGQVSML